MSFDSGSGKLIFDIHSAFLVEYSQATICLQEFYKAVSDRSFTLFLENYLLNLEACVGFGMQLFF